MGKEPIQEIQLHTFGDASGYGVCAAVYAIVTQKSGITQGLVSAKSRLAKQGLTIPRLYLISGHMAANLAVTSAKRWMVSLLPSTFSVGYTARWPFVSLVTVESTASSWRIAYGRYRAIQIYFGATYPQPKTRLTLEVGKEV